MSRNEISLLWDLPLPPFGGLFPETRTENGKYNLEINVLTPPIR